MGRKRKWCSLLCTSLLLIISFSSVLGHEEEGGTVPLGPLVTKEQRRKVVSTDSGTVTAVDIDDGYMGPYHLRFISIEPNSLFIPVLLHRDMVFYVGTGSGTVSWVTEDQRHNMDVEKGDVYRIGAGSIFFLRSHPDPMREKLRINAIFGNMHKDKQESYIEPYSNLSDLINGFDDKILQMGFGVSEDVIESLKSSEKPPPIMPFTQKNETEASDSKMDIIQLFAGGRSLSLVNNKKKHKPFNILKEKPDVENCYGWSTAVTKKVLHVLKGSNIGVFMVNLTKGSMTGPHWNPIASEINVAVYGEAMVQMVIPSDASGHNNVPQGQNMRFKVEAGDTFILPRYHPMVHMSFNNGSFVFMGFTSSAKKNHPQYLAGSRSVLQVMDKEILAASFNVPVGTIDTLLAAQQEAIMLDCTSCAEEQETKMKEEEEKRRREEEEEMEARRRKEERRRQQEEEEARKRGEERRRRQEEEEEARRQEEEERRRQEEEERRREEEMEARRKQEEYRRKQEEEEEARRREEEKRRRREEEEEARRQEEEARRQEEEEEEEARRHEEEEEEEARRHEEEEEEERRRQEEKEEEAARRHEEEERRMQEEEARRQEEEEEARRREEEAAEARRKEEEERRMQEEEERRKEEEEEVGRQEEEEEARRQEGERRRREEEEAAGARRQKEERRRQEEEEEEEETRRREEEARRQEESRRGEEEATRRQEEEEEEGRWEEGGEEEGYEGEEGYEALLPRRVLRV